MATTQTAAREDIDLEAVKAHGGFLLRDADQSDEKRQDGPVKRCPECRRQISVSPRSGVEYGHSDGNDDGERCSRRPDCVDPSAREEWPTYYGANPHLRERDSDDREAEA